MWQVVWAHPKYGSLLASCSYDRQVFVWKEVAPGQWSVIYTYSSHDGSVNSIALCPPALAPPPSPRALSPRTLSPRDPVATAPPPAPPCASPAPPPTTPCPLCRHSPLPLPHCP